VSDALGSYRSKRDFGQTPEPAGETPSGAGNRFVVQRHRASRLHYDLRLEVNGVLASWAIPGGPSLDPEDKRLAMRTEDHPIEYLTFENTIPAGQYGAGDMIVWDWGTYEPEETDDPAAALAVGELKINLAGEKLHGRWTLVRTPGRAEGDPWLLLRKRDERAVPGYDAEAFPKSVQTGRTNEELADGIAPLFFASPPEPLPAIDLAALPEAGPSFVPFMLATAAEAPPLGDGWQHEVKWDGYRVQAVVDGGKVRLFTRNKADAARYFPELAGAPAWIAADSAVVDGEVVALDTDGRPDFGLLQARTGLAGLPGRSRRRSAGEPAPTTAAAPVVYQVFDLLQLNGRSLLGLPLASRRRLLRRALRPGNQVMLSTAMAGDGAEFLEAARSQGLEGILSKRLTSRYLSGERSTDWVKVKFRQEQEVVVIGWVPRQGSERDIGSLVVAVNEDGGLVHVGQVGSGLDGRSIAALHAALDPLERADPVIVVEVDLPAVHWVEPQVVVRVEFGEWTLDGLLRQPVYRGLEAGRDANEVRRETAQPATSSAPVAASESELAALATLANEGTWSVGGHTVRVTNLEKVLFPGRDGEPGVTKRELLSYYAWVAPLLVPLIRDHALNLQRFPDGAAKAGFWQKDIPGHAPTWIRRWTFVSSEGPKDYVVVDRVATLAWLGQEAAIELHPWTSPVHGPDRPRYALIDIDPGSDSSWEDVLILARLFRTALEHLQLRGFPKVTGKRGIQIWIPVDGSYTFDQTRDWVERLSRAIGQLVPDLVSWEWAKSARGGRARLDFTQNAPIRTLVAPYSPRPAAGAPVSAPITWDELDDPSLQPDKWTIRTLPARVAEVGDLYEPMRSLRQRLPAL
jgi:bifunctional non-homologous end joining protein LigD